MRPTGATRKQPRKDKVGGLSDGCLAPGNRVTIDQFEVSKKGRQFQQRERSRSLTSLLEVPSLWTLPVADSGTTSKFLSVMMQLSSPRQCLSKSAYSDVWW